MTQQNFYLTALVTIALVIPGIRAIMQRDYYLGAFMISIAAIGWLAVGLRGLGYLTE